MPRIVDPRAWAALNPVREFVIHNSTDEEVVITYDAETRWIPAVTKIVYPHPKYPNDPSVCCSGKDSEGNWIPGTLVLKDMYADKEMGEFGETRNLWSAANAIKHALGIDVRTGAADSDYAKRGLSVLPLNPEPELVQAVLADGRARYEDWRIAQSREIVTAYDEKNAARARVNMQPVPPGQDYHKAVAILRAYDDKQQALARESLETMSYGKRPLVVAEVPVEEDAHYTGSGQIAAPSLQDQIEQIVNNPEALKILKDEYRMWPMQGKKPVKEAV